MSKRVNNDRSVKFWRVHGLRNLELQRATREGNSFSKRLHEGFEISVIERGTEQLLFRGSSYIAPAGSVVVINPGEVHAASGAGQGGWSHRSFYPTAADVRDAASTAAGRILPTPSFSTPVIKDPHVCRILLRLHTLLESPNSALAQESYSIWVASQLVMRHADHRTATKVVGKEPKAVKLAQEFIRANFSENITLAQLTNETSLSSFHLVRVFTAHVGLPPHAYLNQVRVNRARKLLADGHSIGHVANETGFVDQSHLARHFKRLLGITPGQYARAVSSWPERPLV
jgi:AraC-like DNA-binding protein